MNIASVEELVFLDQRAQHYSVLLGTHPQRTELHKRIVRHLVERLQEKTEPTSRLGRDLQAHQDTGRPVPGPRWGGFQQGRTLRILAADLTRDRVASNILVDLIVQCERLLDTVLLGEITALAWKVDVHHSSVVLARDLSTRSGGDLVRDAWVTLCGHYHHQGVPISPFLHQHFAHLDTGTLTKEYTQVGPVALQENLTAEAEEIYYSLASEGILLQDALQMAHCLH